jgi:SAM-dependent methyltransferase
MSEAKIPRHARYQDYVIRDGRFIGEFEEMYLDFDNPWEQTKREQRASEKFVAIHLLQGLGVRKVLELGSGLGQFTAALAFAGFDVRGIEVSPTAVEKARKQHPELDFQVGDVLDFEKYREFDPDAVVMAEITWLVLDQLDELLRFLRREYRGRYLVHLLYTYGPGVQQYGRSYFTSLAEILAYFDLDYLEWGTVAKPEYEGGARTYFLGRL